MRWSGQRLIDMTRKEYIHKDIFEFEAGGSVSGLKVVYHCSERAWEPGDRRKVIWICHALTANSDPSDWWKELVGPGKLFDTEKYFVVCANMLGSAYGSSGPSSLMPSAVSDGAGCEDDASEDRQKRYYFDFPKITVRDIVRANILVRRHLGIGKIDLMVGGSIGGFQSIEWCIMEPDVIGRAVFIACNARVTPWLTAYNESQRLALEADPTFRECGSLKGGEAGLRCARSIALISYRSYEGYGATQAETGPDTLWADRAASYQRYQGRKLADRFDAYSYYYLTYSVDAHNVGRGRGGVEKALAGVKADCTVIGIDSDRLFPVHEQRFIAEHIPGAKYHEITSVFGHDGFLLEYEQLEKIIMPLLP